MSAPSRAPTAATSSSSTARSTCATSHPKRPTKPGCGPIATTAESHYVFRAPYNDPEHTLLQVSQMHEVHSKGEDTVDGVRTTRYTGVLDYETVVLRMAADVRGTLDTARDAYGRDLPFGAEAWVDGQGRLIQARLTFKDAKTTYASLTISLSELGKPVTVTPPSPDESKPAENNRNILAG